jgi:hypothetical protein
VPAEAGPLDPGAATVTGDEAVANSLNKVVSQFLVANNGAFTFDIDLDVDTIELRGGGTVMIQLAAAILNDQGGAVPNGAITNITFLFRRNQAGETEVIVKDDEDNPEAVDPDGNDNRNTLRAERRHQPAARKLSAGTGPADHSTSARASGRRGRARSRRGGRGESDY